MDALIRLNPQTEKIWKKLPKGERSAIVRNLLTTLETQEIEDEQTNPQQIVKSLITSSDKPSGDQTSYSTPEKQLNEMRRIVQKKNTKPSKTPEDGIKKLLAKHSS